MIYYFLFIVFVFGTAMGSFLNCMADRIYHNQDLWGRSECGSCHKLLKWFDNIPLFAWLNLNGKCRSCQAKISAKYFITELIAGCLFLFAVLYRFNFHPESFLIMIQNDYFEPAIFLAIARDWVLISVLFVIFLMDMEWFVVADIVSWIGVALMVLFSLALGVAPLTILFGAVAGSALFIVLNFLSRGGWMGAGDIGIGLVMGCALGWPLILPGLFISFMLGALWGLGLVILGKKKLNWRNLTKRGEPTEAEIEANALPLGTFLAVGAIIALYYGEPLMLWYLGTLGY